MHVIRRTILAGVSLALSAALMGQTIGALKRVPVPQPVGVDQYVASQSALVALGKALFWDLQAGSDGQTACASCHFHAGADHRRHNQLSNGLSAVAANRTLALSDFPFHQLADVNDNRSAVVRDTTEVAGSAGLLQRVFAAITPGSPNDDGAEAPTPGPFRVAGVEVRQVTARNTPTVINAVYQVRNFWDGRASSVFTGFTPFGDSDPRANSLVIREGQLVAERVRVLNSSLASQAVGPPLNGIEMSYQGRTWPKFGKKMLALRPLALQRVAAEDSVLGARANPDAPGLTPELGYLDLVRAAFRPEYWSSDQLVDGATQAEYNFALFWGLAIQAYEATLVSDDSPFDRFSEGDSAALTAAQQDGLRLFRLFECSNCHSGPEFTLASFTARAQNGPQQRRSNGLDTGFFRTGVRPASEDIGVAAKDDFGNPFSEGVRANPAAATDANGAFKTPTVRNVEFTGPFFHNGNQATLEQVVDFYMRGGDFPQGNFGPDVLRRNASPQDRAALVAFLKSLSDDRVRFERAPFDHPELCVPSGSPEATPGVPSGADRWVGIAAVGAQGNSVPLQSFDELLSGTGADGSRAHSMAEPCRIPGLR